MPYRRGKTGSCKYTRSFIGDIEATPRFGTVEATFKSCLCYFGALSETEPVFFIMTVKYWRGGLSRGCLIQQITVKHCLVEQYTLLRIEQLTTEQDEKQKIKIYFIPGHRLVFYDFR